jgi:LysM repeat protein
VQIADYTSDENNETQDYDYQSLINTKTVPTASGTGKFYRGSSYGVSGGEFGTSGYDPVNPITAGVGQNSRSSYTVQAGDTLQGIAQFVWGDSSLWYLIANANGLPADAPLTAGQNLALPLKGPSNSNNANMFRPYDSASAVGDLSPTMAKPPKGNKCGAFGQILLVAIAVAVTIATSGAALAALSPAVGSIGAGIATVLGTSGAIAGVGGAGLIAAGAIGGAVGSIVSQGVGVATGIQSQFSWKGVALAALAGGIGAGLGPNGAFGKLGAFGKIASPVVAAGIRGATASAFTQGVGVASGLQDKFDWAGVAAAGVGAGLGQWAGGQTAGLGKFGQRTFINMASGVANAASRSVINGTDFGDNLMAALPDIIGQTVGGFAEAAAAGSGRRTIGDDTRMNGVQVASNSGFEKFLHDPLGAATDVMTDYVVNPLVGILSGSTPAPSQNGDIVITASRPALQHGALWKLFDSLGFHQGGIIYNLWNGTPSRAPAMNASVGAVRANINQWAGAPYRYDISQQMVAANRSILARAMSLGSGAAGSRFGATGQPSFVISANHFVVAPDKASPGLPLSKQLGYASNVYDVAVAPNAAFAAEVFMNDPAPALRFIKGGSFILNAAAGYAQYRENLVSKHDPFASAVGAAGSTLIPALAGAGAGAAIGSPGSWPGMVGGGLIGASVGYAFSDDINRSGMSATEYLESGRPVQQSLQVHDSNGVTLSEFLDYAFRPMPNDL